MSEITDQNTIILSGGGVAYSLDDAAESIDELIETLESAKLDGMKYVALSSGNYRGAKWVSLSADYTVAEDMED